MDYKKIEKHKLELKKLDLELNAGFKKIGCPSCDAEVPAKDININDKIAKCGNCNAVFSFEKAIESFSRKTKIRQELIRPEGIELFYFKDELEISVRRPTSTGEEVVAGIMPIFTFIFTMAYFGKDNVSIWLPIIGWLMGVIPILYLILNHRRKVHINIDNKYLSIINRPKGFNKDQHYHASEIDQVYLKKQNNRFNVMMILNGANGQKHVQLITEFRSASKARFIEQEIEKHLGITDRIVPEEAT